MATHASILAWRVCIRLYLCPLANIFYFLHVNITHIIFGYFIFVCLVLHLHPQILIFTNVIQGHKTSPSMGFSRQEYWSGLPFPSPGDLPKPGIEHKSPALRADALTSEPSGMPFRPFKLELI